MDWSALNATMGWGALSKTQAIRRGLEIATSPDYRAAHPEEFAQLVHWRSSQQSHVDYLRQVTAGARFDAAHRVQTITAPTLVLHGTNDRVVPAKNAELLAQAIPHTKLRLIEGAGHLVFIERADEVNQRIIEFLSASPRLTIPPFLQDKKAAFARTARPLGRLKNWFEQRLHSFRAGDRV
jgi:pimeloyl-ACP methyl ester carboxylesterase